MRKTWLAALCLLAAPHTSAHPYGIDDLLRLESYGQAVVDPHNRWAVVERRDRYDSAPSYRYDYWVRRLLSKLMLVDLHEKGRAVPFFAQDRQAGYWIGSFSPSGDRLSVFRLRQDHIQIGVVEMATRKVDWLQLVPDLPDARPAPIWLDDNRLLVVTLDDGGLPALFQAGNYAQRASIRGWSDAEAGKIPSSDILGSGRYLATGTRYRARQIVEFDLKSNMTRSLFKGDVLDLALSGDRSELAVLTKGPAVQPDPNLPIDPGFEPRRQRLSIIDLAAGTRREPCSCDILASLLHWSPQGARLLFYARGDGEDWPAGHLYIWDRRSGSLGTPLPETLKPVLQIAGGNGRLARAAWAGDRALVLAERASDRRRDWYLIGQDGSPLALTASLPAVPADLAAIDANRFVAGNAEGLWQGDWQGRLTKVAEGPVREVRTVALDGHSLGTRAWFNEIPGRAFAVQTGPTESTAIVEDETGRFDVQPLAKSDKVLATTSTGQLLVFSEDEQGTGALALVRHGERDVVDRINAHLANVEPVRRVVLHSKAADGKQLNHWLLLPAASGGPPPRLVVVPYAGFTYGETPPYDSLPSTPAVMTQAMLLAGQGYAVLQPSIPLADTPGDPLPAIRDKLLEALDAAQASGLVSKEKPFLLGHSYGGYTVLGMAGLSDRFAAVVAVSGPYDIAAIYGSTDPRLDYGEIGISLTIPIGWSEGGQGRMGVPPWAALERYARNSPFYHLKDVRTPILLVTADLDYVPEAQADRAFMALYRLGKDAQLLRYRGEFHSLTSPANARDYWSHVFAFLRDNQASDSRPQ
ncbi:prolyl oligopeptidase family serine peptidase [Sphingomonas sp. JC676]|uniref:S9 family peptidase n=1 Tax=Sphingomonas sp. JC676 TaxID=2768065 RepID=UPI0016583357|nr:prolyl oligopeptidase family serine peptidase [Sphingomonas sp. JC676]MBC9035142.1 prolyl oligopeptidase family serine peptidase [Sphingomonas sp. JC676]